MPERGDRGYDIYNRNQLITQANNEWSYEQIVWRILSRSSKESSLTTPFKAEKKIWIRRRENKGNAFTRVSQSIGVKTIHRCLFEMLSWRFKFFNVRGWGSIWKFKSLGITSRIKKMSNLLFQETLTGIGLEYCLNCLWIDTILGIFERHKFCVGILLPRPFYYIKVILSQLLSTRLSHTPLRRYIYNERSVSRL